MIPGPSPLARGSRILHGTVDVHAGSIPARAGEPWSRATSRATHGVHPRSRGGAFITLEGESPMTGPSPLARGSRSRARRDSLPGRSIPARAGEPCWPSGSAARVRVHPRSRGGAVTSAVPNAPLAGPSPLARGSPDAIHRHEELIGSIPARAGEPPALSPSHCCRRVHPRSRGGACVGPEPVCVASGPSPLARGSPYRLTH